MNVRAEYNAWEIEVLLDFYKETNEQKHLDRAIKLGNELKKVQAKNGAFYFDMKIKKIWSGEPGLCSWSLYRLYHYTKNETYKKMADKAVNYILKHPVKKKSDEKRLYYVFVAWNIYPFITRWQMLQQEKDKKRMIQEADKLIKAQKMTGRWTIVLHYDLYVAWVLMHVYHQTKDTKYLNAVKKFLSFAKHHKTPLGYPIHYLPFGLIEIASGYATNQITRLNYYLYFETGDEKYKNFADKQIPQIEKRLTRKEGIAKLYKDQTPNALATMWYEHNKLLQKITSMNYFEL